MPEQPQPEPTVDGDLVAPTDLPVGEASTVVPAMTAREVAAALQAAPGPVDGAELTEGLAAELDAGPTEPPAGLPEVPAPSGGDPAASGPGSGGEPTSGRESAPGAGRASGGAPASGDDGASRGAGHGPGAPSGRSLPSRASVVIVGGGVMGTSIAFHLAEAGVRDVLLLERGSLAGGSTSKAAGGVRAQFSDAVNIALGARSLEAFVQFDSRPEQAIDLHRVGYLFLLTRPEDVATYEAATALQNSLGVSTRMLDASEAAALAPIVSTDDVLAASFHAGDGYCAPEAVVLGYARGARRHGATVLTGVEVTGISTRDSSSGPARITGVRTTAGDVETDTVICCAGPWSQALAALCGVDLPVTPLRRQILVTEPLSPPLAALTPPSMPMTIDVASTFYLHPEGPGILLGMSYEGEQPGFDLDLSDAWLPDLTTAIENRAPALLDVGIAHGWAGLYEITPDHNAVIGEATGVSRFLYATGFSGHGFLQGPAVGEVLRDLYLGREPFVDVSPLSADRFAAGAARPEHHIV